MDVTDGLDDSQNNPVQVYADRRTGVGEYKKLPPKRFPPRSLRETAEGRFWRSYRSPVVSQQIGAVTSLDFCPSRPYDLAVTSSTRVVVYDEMKRAPKRSFTRFTDLAYSGSFRPDGKLLVAGGETGIVQVFDAGSRTVLRKLKGHTRAVQWVRYSSDRLHLLSCSDDNSVRWWDVASQEAIVSLQGHSDYVRCGAMSPSSTDLWATGSYDHTVNLWDVRTSSAVATLQHGRPVEDVIFFPSGGIVATAGGNFVNIWDVISGPRILHSIRSHQKTVTCLTLAAAAARGGPSAPASSTIRLLAASLDGHVKTYDMETFKLTHAARYPAPILSLAVSGSGMTIAVGMADGSLSLRQRRPTSAAAGRVRLGGSRAGRFSLDGGLGLLKRRRSTSRRVLTASTYRYFVRGKSEKAAAEEFLVAQRKRVNMAPHDKYFRRFRHADALTSALKTSRPEVVAAVIEELVARGGLGVALANRDAASLEPLMAFVAKYIIHPLHSSLLVQIAHRLLDLYASTLGLSLPVDRQVELLRERVLVEVRVHQSMAEIHGILHLLLSSSATHTGSTPLALGLDS